MRRIESKDLYPRSGTIGRLANKDTHLVLRRSLLLILVDLSFDGSQYVSLNEGLQISTVY